MKDVRGKTGMDEKTFDLKEGLRKAVTLKTEAEYTLDTLRAGKGSCFLSFWTIIVSAVGLFMCVLTLSL